MRSVPGLGAVGIGVIAALWIASLLPGTSALLIAIVLGVAARNVLSIPAALEPGIAVAAKRVLRIGIVLLGAQLSVGNLLSIGPGMIAVVVAVVTIGILSSVLVGKLLGMSRSQRLLIACGFSICGAAAVAAVDAVIDDDDEEVVTAIALVVLFGTLMIPLLPAAASLAGFGEIQAGLWAGASIHEVAQVVAAGGAIGVAALNVAVVVKLARVLMLAPVLLVVGAVRRREVSVGPVDVRRPSLLPAFVVGFLLMVALRSTVALPVVVWDVAKTVEVVCLTAAMCALGMGVRFRMFLRVGLRPFVLAAVSTIIVGVCGFVGVLLVG